MHSITYIRHCEQTSHRIADPPLKRPAGPVAVDGDAPYDQILCSPYLRCRQTAQLLRPPVPITVDARLSEYHGHKQRRGPLRLHDTTPPAGVPGLDERWQECAHRLDEFAEYVQTLRGRVLVVTHGVVVRYMQTKLRGHTEWPRGRDVPFGAGFTHRNDAVL
jgi:broad specificity phosphatase PhoE